MSIFFSSTGLVFTVLLFENYDKNCKLQHDMKSYVFCVEFKFFFFGLTLTVNKRQFYWPLVAPWPIELSSKVRNLQTQGSLLEWKSFQQLGLKFAQSGLLHRLFWPWKVNEERRISQGAVFFCKTWKPTLFLPPFDLQEIEESGLTRNSDHWIK